MARLIFAGDKFGGRTYEIAVERTTVGRGDHNTLTIHDESVSMSHCEILVWGDEVIVRDLGSSNGTLVNGVLLRHGQRQLKHGQVVRFGEVDARLVLDEPSGTDTVTGDSAIHGYARYLKQQQAGKPEPPAPVSLNPGANADGRPLHHTVLLPRQPEATPLAPPALANSQLNEKPPGKRVRQVVIAALLILGLLAVIWLLFGNR